MGRVGGAVAAVAATAILISITIVINNHQLGPPTAVLVVDSTGHLGCSCGSSSTGDIQHGGQYRTLAARPPSEGPWLPLLRR